MMKNSAIVRINEDNYNKLKKIDGKTMDGRVNHVIDVVEKDMPISPLSSTLKSINVYKSTIDRLDSFKITLTEPRDCTLARMLYMFEEKNQHGEEAWTYFKITSTINKKISLEGQVEYYSKDIVFNSNGEVYGYEVPSSYMVNGEDMTQEYNSFLKKINLTEIIKLVMDQTQDTISEFEDYLLEVKF